MLEELEKIQKRYEEYISEYEKILIDFHDSDTLNYYNDRFGYDNPRANEAYRGIEIERKLKEMKKEIEKFANEFCINFSKLK